MVTSIQELNAAGIPFTPTNLETIQNLVNRYSIAGFNVSEKMIVSFIIKNYNKKKPNIKEIFSELHTMKLAPIKKGLKVGRNSPCPCGKAKKYKNCCIQKK